MRELINLGRLQTIAALLMLVVAGASCVDGVSSQSTDDPFGTGIVVINPTSGLIFGNGRQLVEAGVNVEAFPDGSGLSFRLTATSLASAFRGCVVGGDSIIQNGQASGTYLAGINIQPGAVIASGNAIQETVNLAVTVSRPNSSDTESDFITLILQAVGIIPPAAQNITVPFEADSPLSIFVPLSFQSVGIPANTIVFFSLTRPDLGGLTIPNSTISGSELNGAITVQYNAFPGVGGTQEICASVPINYPDAFVPPCPDIANQTILECVTIVQGVDAPMPALPEACGNGVDDDDDGDIDCDDSPDCDLDPSCETGPMQCTNGVDDDGDGLADCADPGCAAIAPCEFPEVTCDDGRDNDGDGFTDCDDLPECSQDRSPICGEAGADCADGIDNDGDGDTDCADSLCAAAAPCQPIEGAGGMGCGDGFDNDGDGLVDCADNNCPNGTICNGIGGTCMAGVCM